MTRNFSKAIAAGILGMSMAVMPLTLPAKAQVTDTPGTSTNTAPRTTTYDERDSFDWGWLGLLGLLGLAGLAGKKREDEPTRYRDPNAPGATTYRE